jgi:prevent-host-death family protein
VSLAQTVCDEPQNKEQRMMNNDIDLVRWLSLSSEKNGRGRMPLIVNVHEAKTQLSRLLDRAHGGEEIILAKAGKPYARLVPLEDAQPRVPGMVDGRVDDAFFEPLPESELKAWNQ